MDILDVTQTKSVYEGNHVNKPKMRLTVHSISIYMFVYVCAIN